MTAIGAKLLCHPSNCERLWSDVNIATDMKRISLFDKAISRRDAIGVGVLGGVLGVIMGSSGESTLSGWLVGAGAGLAVGAALGAVVGALLRGFGGAVLGLVGGVVLGTSTGEFKWLIPAAVVGPIVGAMAGPVADATIRAIDSAVKDHFHKKA